MLQFNLLPDVKIQYIKTRRTKRLIMLVSSVVSALSIAAVVVLFLTVQVGQKRQLSQLTDKINKEKSALASIENLDKIITIQNQLNTLPELHGKKPAASRFLASFLPQVFPNNPKVTLSEVTIDFVNSKMVIAGESPDIVTINSFADTLKFAKFTTTPAVAPGIDPQTVASQKSEEKNAFSNVVSSISRNEGSDSYSYIFELNFESDLFANKLSPTLVVPNIITTRSILERPIEFKQQEGEIE